MPDWLGDFYNQPSKTNPGYIPSDKHGIAGDQDASSQHHVISRHYCRYSAKNTQMIVPRLLTLETS